MSGPHETVESRSVFEGRILQVRVDRVRLPSGELAEREVVIHPGAVGIVAIHEEQVLLVRQHRHAAGRDLLEIPAGKLDRPGEVPFECASRELEEETGYRGRLEPLTDFFNSPGYSTERFHLFSASELVKVASPAGEDEGEPLQPVWVPRTDAESMLTDGRIVDAKTMIGLLASGWGPGGR